MMMFVSRSRLSRGVVLSDIVRVGERDVNGLIRRLAGVAYTA